MDVPEAARGTARARRDELESRLMTGSGRTPRTVEIADARGIRALAHEARQLVIETLYEDGEARTATELAGRTGLTPSAMSYHLRALERWGVVERVADQGDARNRPWRAAGTSIRIRDDTAAAHVATDLYIQQAVEAWGRRRAYARSLSRDERDSFVGLSQSTFWLDDAELEQLGECVQRGLLELQAAGWRDEPGPGRRRVSSIWSLLPEPPAEPPAGPDAGPADTGTPDAARPAPEGSGS